MNSQDYLRFGDVVRNDFMGMFLGELLGHGTARMVYTLQRQPHLVVKVESNAHSFQNVAEWQLWEDLKGTEFAKWLAPCRVISACGSVLIQDRTMPLRVGKDFQEFPTELPTFLSDLKPSNFGKIGRQIVAHDYAVNNTIFHGIKNGVKMRKISRKDWEWGLRDEGESL